MIAPYSIRVGTRKDRRLNMHYYGDHEKIGRKEMAFDISDSRYPMSHVFSNITRDDAVVIRDRLNEFIAECEKDE